MVDEFEMEISKIDFNYLYKIVKINVDKVTFRKYSINRLSLPITLSNMMSEKKELVVLNKEIGDETYVVKPEVSILIAGKVGKIIKKFNVELSGKKRKKMIVNEITEVI